MIKSTVIRSEHWYYNETFRFRTNSSQMIRSNWERKELSVLEKRKQIF